MNFANVKGLTIPQGKVTKIELLKDSMRTLLWQAIRYLKGYTIGGNAEVKQGKILGVGDEFAWNQLQEPMTDFTRTSDNVSLTRQSNQITAVVGQGGALSLAYLTSDSRITLVGGHKYLYRGMKNGATNVADSGNALWGAYGRETGNGLIFTADSTHLLWQSEIVIRANAPAGIYVCTPQLFDLTAMGITINSLEDFKTYLKSHSMMDKDATEIPYFGYDAGSVKTSLPIVARSRNLWDEEWELGTINPDGSETSHDTYWKFIHQVKIKPNTSYYVHKPSSAPIANQSWAVEYDINGSFLRRMQLQNTHLYTSSTDAFNVRMFFGGSGSFFAPNNDVSIYEGTTSYGYVKYESTTYPLLVSSPLYNTDVAKFGEGVTRKMGKKVFDGTEGWTVMKASAAVPGKEGWLAISPIIPDMKPMAECFTASYVFKKVVWYESNIGEMSHQNSTSLNVTILEGNEYTSATWKAHLADLYAQGNPLTIIYELAEPVTEAVDLPKIVDYQPTILTTDTEVVGECKAFSTIEEELADKWGVSVDKVGTYTFSENDGWYNEDYAEGRWRKDSLPDAMAQPSGSDLPHLYCSIYTSATKADIFNGRVIGITIQASNSVRIFDNTLSSVAEIKAKMANQTIYFEKA